MTIGERLRLIRKEADLSQDDVGAIAGVTKQAISQIERGVTTNPEAATLEPVCRKLGINLHWLMTGKGPRRLNDSPKADKGEQDSQDERDFRSRAAIPDPAILLDAVSLLLYDLDHGPPRSAITATKLLLSLYQRIAAGEFTDDDAREFEADARSRGEKAGVQKDERSRKRERR